MSNNSREDSGMLEEDQYEIDDVDYWAAQQEQEFYESEPCSESTNDQKLDERKETLSNRHTASDF